MEINAAIQEYLWPLSEHEKALLETSIQRDGCRDPLCCWGDVLLDGHNRYEICQRTGKPFTTVQISGINCLDEALLWVSANQRGRRNLPEARMIELVRKDEPVERRLAKERQAATSVNAPRNSKGQLKPVVQSLAQPDNDNDPSPVKELSRSAGKTRDILAAKAGVSHGTFTKAAKVFDEGKPEIQEAMRKGEISIDAAYKKTVGAHVGQNSGDNEWYTPKDIIELVHKTMGGIDCDPASSAAANKIVKATVFHTEKENGLIMVWGKRVFLNPPYSQPLVGRFADTLLEKLKSGEVEQAVVLINNATETRFFQRLAGSSSAICFPAGRVKFWHPSKESIPLQGQAIIYFGKKPNGFMETFTSIGFCAEIFR